MKNKKKVKLRSLNKKIAAEKLVTLGLAGLLATVGTLDNLGINLFDLLDNFKHNFNNPSSSTELNIDKTESYKPSDVKTDDEDVPVLPETTEDKSKIPDGEDINVGDKTEQAVNSDIQSPVSTGTLGEASSPSSDLDSNLKPEDTHIHTLGEWVALNGIFDASYCPEDGALAGVKLHNIRITNIKKISNENGTHNLVITFTCTNCGQEKTITKTVECKYGEEITWDEIFEYETCDCGYKHTIGRHNLDSGTINYQGKTIEYTCTNSRCGYKLVRDYNPTISVSPGSGSGGSGSSGSGHDKPTHIHYLGEWVSLNDDLEANYCPEDGVLVGTRAHKYDKPSNTAISNQDGTHTTTTQETCLNCNHIKTTTKTDSCNYNFKWNDTLEYNECSECGYIHIIGGHNLDKGTIDTVNNEITYKCQNEGCDYSKTESYTKPVDPTHKHIMGEWKDNGNNEARVCIAPGCTAPDKAIQTRPHSWGNYTYKDDSTEERHCNTCTAISTKGHSYTNSTSYSIVDDTHHTRTITRNCSSCNDSKIVDTYENENCSFTIFVGETDANITYKCACGNTKTVDKTVEHTHTWGEWINNGANEARVCIAPGCTAPDKAIQTRPHSWGNYTYKDDSTEERHCNTCTAISTKGHSYTNSTSYSIVDDTHHTRTITRNCSSCNDSKIVDTFENENCSFTIFVSETDANITYKCACGNTKTVDKTVEHTHAWGEWKDNGNNEARVCIDPGCTAPDKAIQTRPHSWGNYTYKDDSTEERHCNTCTAISTKGHSYTNSTSYSIVDDTHHTKTIARNCSSCNDSKIVDTYENENCSFTIFVGETDANITYKCACGNTKTVDKTVGHTHTWGEWINNGANEVRYCVAPGCSDPIAKENKPHSWGEWNADHTERNCKTCNAVETHTHTFGDNSTSYEKNGDMQHDVVVTHICSDSNCGKKEEVSRTTINCSFTTIISETDTTITKACVCGNTFTEDKNKEHNHTYGAWQDNGANEICYCTDPNCTVPDGDAKTQDHQWGEWNADHTERTCTSCGKVETHSHTYTNSDDYSPSGEKTHSHTVTGVCECGDAKEISRTEEGCSFTKGTEVTDPTTGITTITYSCVCGNSYTETKKPAEHTHAGGTLQEENGSGSVCKIFYRICAECGERYDISSEGHNLKDIGRGKQECTVCNKTFGADGVEITSVLNQVPPIEALINSSEAGQDIQGIQGVPNEGAEKQETGDIQVVPEDEKPKQETGDTQKVPEGEEPKQDSEKIIIVVEDDEEDKIDEIIAEQEEGKDIILVVDDEEEIVDQIIFEQDQVISDAQAEAEARLEEILASDADEAAKDEAIDKIIEDTERIIGEAMAKADAEFADLIDEDPMVLELTM